MRGVPGVNTQGRTLREARANLRDALPLILDTNGRVVEETFGRQALRTERIAVGG